MFATDTLRTAGKIPHVHHFPFLSANVNYVLVARLCHTARSLRGGGNTYACDEDRARWKLSAPQDRSAGSGSCGIYCTCARIKVTDINKIPHKSAWLYGPSLIGHS